MTTFRSDGHANDRLLIAARFAWYVGLLAALGCWIAWQVLRSRLANGQALAAPVQLRSHLIIENGRSFWVDSADARLHWLGNIGFFVCLGVAFVGWLLIQRAKSLRK